jgi:hypothetical protein
LGKSVRQHSNDAQTKKKEEPRKRRSQPVHRIGSWPRTTYTDSRT